MTLAHAATRILRQLAYLINQIHPSDFSRPSQVLSGSSIGKHVRHTLEFFTCLEGGCVTGVVNYDKRNHDPLMEADLNTAAIVIDRLIRFVDDLRDDAPMLLEVGYDISNESYQRVTTNRLRELVYNIEHAVHHMAIIKIAVPEIAPYVALPGDFGVAVSTLRHAQDSVPLSPR